jgi:hypothetical protein
MLRLARTRQPESSTRRLDRPEIDAKHLIKGEFPRPCTSDGGHPDGIALGAGTTVGEQANSTEHGALITHSEMHTDPGDGLGNTVEVAGFGVRRYPIKVPMSSSVVHRGHIAHQKPLVTRAPRTRRDRIDFLRATLRDSARATSTREIKAARRVQWWSASTESCPLRESRLSVANDQESISSLAEAMNASAISSTTHGGKRPALTQVRHELDRR